MALSLVVGPAHAGKVAHLLDRYLECAGADPWLVVPTGGDVARVELDLLRRSPALVSGTIGTFDDLFAAVAGDGDGIGVLGPAARSLLLRSVVDGAALAGLARSAGTRGFVEALGTALSELGSGLVDPGRVVGDLGALAAAYRGELSRLELAD
ncbi:MAG: hypothetical protein FJW96_04280, partial [Actinobacteria bacterium]|nr:hypothetical protein [Actinomycetota bacterium]